MTKNTKNLKEGKAVLKGIDSNKNIVDVIMDETRVQESHRRV